MPDANITYTPNLSLARLPANYHVWAQIMNDNLTVLDAAVSGFIVYDNWRGAWSNSTHYANGDTVVDLTTAVIWTTQVDHTSSSIPTTFAQEQILHPTYWVPANAPANKRGAWMPNTQYNVNDFVLADGVKYAMCLVQHVSGTVFNTDAALGYWSVLIDFTSGTATVAIGSVPPALPITNQMWWNSDLGQLFVWYNDGNTTQWVPATPVGASTNPTNVRTAFGAKGDGVTDDTAALQAAFTSIAANGGTLYIPTGVYPISNGIGVGNPTKSFRVMMDPSATIQATSAFPANTKMIYFLSAGTDPTLMISMIWEGGKLDGSLRPAYTVAGPDIIDINGAGYNLIALRDMYIYGGLDLLSGNTGTDSCVGIAQAHNIEISGCWIQGASDAGIYISGSNDGLTIGDTCRVIGNNIRWCSAGVVSKRGFRHNIVMGNNIQRCGTAIGMVGTPDVPVNTPSGLNASILSNRIEWCNRGISLSNSPRGKIAFNQIINTPRQYQTGAALAGEGIYLVGNSYGQVAFNTVECDTTVFTPDNGSAGVRLLSMTDTSGTYNSTNNDIHQNVFTNVGLGVHELDANQDFNNYSMNSIKTLSPGGEYSNTAGVNSTWTSMRLPNQRYMLNYSMIGIGGPEGSEAVRITKTVGASNFFSFTGTTDASSTGQGVVLNSAGTAANCSMTIGTKGVSGLLLLGGVGIANEVMRLTKASTQVNGWSVSGSNTTLPITLSARGNDTNVGMLLTPKGTGSVQITIANVQNFASDALAAAGGVPIGGIYRNASALQIRVT